jgi:hypothetical protein
MRLSIGAVLGIAVYTTSPGLAQFPDTLDFTSDVPIASFESATSIDADLDGNLYVADFQRDQVVKLNSKGAVLSRWGGSGSGANEFDGPASLDATNGLRILVADQGNGRVQWLTNEGVLVGSVELGKVASRWSPERSGEQIRSRPIAATSDAENDFYAIDSATNSILHGKRDRSVEIIVDGRSLRDPELVQIVAILLDSDMLFVGDRATGYINVFDRLGTFVRTMCNGQCKGLNAIEKYPDRLFVVTDNSVRIYFEHGLLERTLVVRSEDALVDIQATRAGWYFLTQTKLFFRRF